MSRRGLILRAILAIGISTILCPRSAAAEYSRLIRTNDPQIEIVATSPFEQPPAGGTWPLRIEVKNRSGFDRSYQLSSSATNQQQYNHRYEYRTTFGAAANSVTNVEFYLPIPASDPKGKSSTGYGGINISWTLNGPGIIDYSQNVSSTATYNREASKYYELGGFVVLGQTFTPNLKDLQGQAEACGRSWTGSVSETAMLPQHWLGYSGVKSVWLTAFEWSSTTPATKTALKDWVLAGGQLYLINDQSWSTNLEFSHLRPHGKYEPNRYDFGLGDIYLVFQQNIADTLQKVVVEVCETARNAIPNRASSTAYEADWRLASQFNIESAATGLALVLFLYAILVAPINLFYFARNQRANLYWTTPLLAASTASLLVLYAGLTDGLGGEGRRNILQIVEPAENRAVILQEQIAKGGLLLDRSFSLPPTVFVQQLISRGTLPRDSRVTHYRPQESRTFLRDTKSAGGDWFRGRTVQAQLLVDVQPSRSDVQFTRFGNGTLSFISRFSFPLAELFYRDGEGRLWRSKNVRTGVESQLTSTTEEQFSDALLATTMHLGPTLKEAVEALQGKRNYFFGVSAANAEPSGSPLALATHRSIRWHDDKTIVIGPAISSNLVRQARDEK